MTKGKRFKAFKVNPGVAAPGKAYVYDYDAGMIARDSAGKLVYTKTFADATKWARIHNAAHTA